MKTGKVAKALNIDRKTVSNWTDMRQFRQFFTTEAQGINRTQRDYLETDVLVLNTIRVLRNQGLDWQEIEQRLSDGERDKNLPPAAMMVETTAPIAQYGRMVEMQAALDAAEEQIEKLQGEVEHLKGEVNVVREQERKKAKDQEQILVQNIIALNRQIARLELHVEMLNERWKSRKRGIGEKPPEDNS